MSGLLRTVESLELAAAWLTQAFTECTCPAPAVADLDVDPDCPGLVPTADGCRSHANVAARVVLHDAGIPVPSIGLEQLRSAVLTMYRDLVDEIDAIAGRTRHFELTQDEQLQRVIRLLAGAMHDDWRAPMHLPAVEVTAA